MESKIYKISAYLVDINGDYGEDYISWLLKSYSDLTAKHLKIESADIGEWYDEHPLNYRNSDVSECEKYFEKANWELHEEYYGDTVVSREWCCSNCGHAALRWSGMIENLRGEPYKQPDYKCCPNCKINMEG